jgi:RNA polymerase sigma factor (TIGR02999 family)
MARQGDPDAVGRVFDRVYAEVRRIAHAEMRRVKPAETMNTTAVVHEAYLKLVTAAGIAWEDRAHFFAVAATAMRQVLVDHARRASTGKRGGGNRAIPLDDVDSGSGILVGHDSDELLALDAALTQLSSIDERLGRVVDLRYFAGLSVDETAKVLGVAERTVKRDWRRARACLLAALAAEEPS